MYMLAWWNITRCFSSAAWTLCSASAFLNVQDPDETIPEHLRALTGTLCSGSAWDAAATAANAAELARLERQHKVVEELSETQPPLHGPAAPPPEGAVLLPSDDATLPAAGLSDETAVPPLHESAAPAPEEHRQTDQGAAPLRLQEVQLDNTSLLPAAAQQTERDNPVFEPTGKEPKEPAFCAIMSVTDSSKQVSGEVVFLPRTRGGAQHGKGSCL